MNKIFVFRHTQTLYNYNHFFCGHIDADLTNRGIEQAGIIADKLKNQNIHIAYASPLKRTQQTLEIALKYHNHVFYCIDPRIKERDYGWLQGQSKDKWAVRNYRLFKIFHRSYYIPPPGGESLRAVRARVLPFAKDVEGVARKFKVNIAICAHGNSIRGIRTYFEKLGKKQFNKIETKEGQLFEYRVK